MHFPTQSVSLQFAHDSVAETFGVLLHGCRHVAYAVAGFGLRRTFIKSLFGDVHQLPNFPGNLANGKRICRITNKPLHKRTAIDRNDVALFENAFRGWDTVNHLFVYRYTQRSGKSLIPEEGGNCSVRADEILGNRIQLLGGDTRTDVATHFRQRLRHQDVVLPEQLYLLVCL